MTLAGSNIRADVLVIGAGGAGLRAAIEAASAGARVAIVCKSLLGKAHTVVAEGGIAAAIGSVDSRDNWQTHFRDTMAGGKYLNNWRMAELHAQEAPGEIENLELWGALFDRTPEGGIMQRLFGGHTHKRLVQVGDRTGLELMRTLQDRTVELKLDVYMEYTITRLLKSDGRIAGAVGFARETGRVAVFEAPAVIIATGGSGRLYSVTSNSWEGTADGQALAFEAGAELMDMEFIQFHPTGMVWPPSVRGILVTESVRGEGGLLTNNAGERFMEKYDPQRMELSTRDVVARAIATEVREGRGSPHGGMYLSIAHKPARFIKKKLPSMYTQFLDFAKIDITKERMEVYPTTHYIMGGIRVDAETAATNIVGLFAAGECAGGLHGANRLGGNSLSDLLVFGRRAGAAAAAFAHSATRVVPDPDEVARAEREMLAPFEVEGGENPFDVQTDLQSVMMTNVGVFRTEAGLLEALRSLDALRVRAAHVRATGSRLYNPGWHTALDVKNMVCIAETIIRSALKRRESRGAHTRIDCPEPSDDLQRVNTVTTNLGLGVHVEFVRRPPLPGRLAEIVFGRGLISAPEPED
ncbi:MAG: FAD-binding protein, partial [Candidatus Eremiobacteraeota bacterium]|nr:FAD-binding protein [Candidatus Eremiobacteraeota bacterium]